MTKSNDVIFVYDGECPLCSSAAHAIRIQKKFGLLRLIDARTASDDPVIRDIERHGFDLDAGMVIVSSGQFYHGKDALKFMARHGEAKNAFTAICKSLFWSEALSSLTYPWMRAVRNWFLLRKKVGRIDNLDLKNEPIFKSIFGTSWDELPPVMHKHYANRSYTNDMTVVKGTLDVTCKGPLKVLAPLMKLLGQIPAHTENNVPVTVFFQSDLNSKAFQFKRIFNFNKIPPYIFRSRMMQIKNNEVIEIMRFGLGWKMLYRWTGEKVVLEHRGYALSVFGHFIPVPLTFFMGKGYAEEIAIDDNTFDMITHITHPLWGKIYEYKGRFKITQES